MLREGEGGIGEVRAFEGFLDVFLGWVGGRVGDRKVEENEAV